MVILHLLWSQVYTTNMCVQTRLLPAVQTAEWHPMHKDQQIVRVNYYPSRLYAAESDIAASHSQWEFTHQLGLFFCITSLNVSVRDWNFSSAPHDSPLGSIKASTIVKHLPISYTISDSIRFSESELQFKLWRGWAEISKFHDPRSLCARASMVYPWYTAGSNTLLSTPSWCHLGIHNSICNALNIATSVFLKSTVITNTLQRKMTITKSDWKSLAHVLHGVAGPAVKLWAQDITLLHAFLSVLGFHKPCSKLCSPQWHLLISPAVLKATRRGNTVVIRASSRACAHDERYMKLKWMTSMSHNRWTGLATAVTFQRILVSVIQCTVFSVLCWNKKLLSFEALPCSIYKPDKHWLLWLTDRVGK